MWTVGNADEAKANGRKQAREDMLNFLTAEWDRANEVFMLFREQDPYYRDPRTDFALGYREEVSHLIDVARKL